MSGGGDDLESDDEYLNQDWHTNQKVDVELDESNNKRSHSEIGKPEETDALLLPSNKKAKSPKHFLIEHAREISQKDGDVQASFLWTAYTHALALKGEDSSEDKFTADQFAKPREDGKNSSSKYERSMVKYLKSGVLFSMKRLKKWRHEKSPCVIIVCISALRAVAVLKEISSLNIRAAKLFAKHMKISDQVNMLNENSYSIAVGTPGRLLKLTETKDGDGDEALSLEHTELILIDCAEDKKKFTVCASNDTAPDLMKLIQSGVIPQMKKRKTIKFGMF
uniref:Uncharacterized protein n=1 Tax=Chaetoceros debilis TaxID=122233 RepID=A0A7S3PUB8_9STRA|mmetsp:Transcript_12519/g.18802  ORF Transcript_12519/g.18802 Transcript_12519/m.18802 type:complete len:279 (+) Transcript_12519:130-966(+)